LIVGFGLRVSIEVQVIFEEFQGRGSREKQEERV